MVERNVRGVGSGSGGTPSRTDRWKECYKEVGVGPEGRRHERTHVKDSRKHYYKEEGVDLEGHRQERTVERTVARRGVGPEGRRQEKTVARTLARRRWWVRRDTVREGLLNGRW